MVIKDCTLEAEKVVVRLLALKVAVDSAKGLRELVDVVDQLQGPLREDEVGTGDRGRAERETVLWHRKVFQRL